MIKNVLLFFTDQQRFDTINALGNKNIKTPALDRLVKSGISYTNTYTPSPVCVPARFSMLTGKYCHNTHCTDNGTMPTGYKSIMHVLKDNGYQTHGVGKMHFTFKNDELFGYDSRDISEEIGSDKQDDYRDYLDEVGYSHVKDKHGIRGEMYYIPQPSQLPDEHHNNTWVANKTIEYLENRDTNKPFFLMSSYIKPHPPFEAPVPFNKLYRAYEMPLPKTCDNYENMHTYWNKIQNRYKGRDAGKDINLLRTMKAYYYASISHVDYNLGKVLDYLEDNKLMESTLIIFSSDHGEMLGDYNCFGKRCFYDGSARVPLIVKAPNQKKSEICSNSASLVDIVPTILDYTGIKTDMAFDGKSLFKIKNNSNENREVYSQYSNGEYGTYMIVKGRYKYIYSVPDEKEWFFDKQVDENELRNLAYNISFIDKKNNIKKVLIDRLINDGYTKAIENNQFKKFGKKIPFVDPDEQLVYQDSVDSLPKLKGYTE